MLTTLLGIAKNLLILGIVGVFLVGLAYLVHVVSTQAGIAEPYQMYVFAIIVFILMGAGGLATGQFSQSKV